MALYTEEINGGNLVLGYFAAGVWNPISFSTSHSLELSVDTREVTNKDTCGWKKMKTSKLSFSGSSDGMNSYADAGTGGLSKTTFTTMAQLAISKDPIWIVSQPKGAPCPTDWTDFGDTLGDDDLYVVAYGEVIITGVTTEYPDEESSTYSVSFEGAGPLYFDDWGTVSALNPPVAPAI